jgi:hypothetical protein
MEAGPALVVLSHDSCPGLRQATPPRVPFDLTPGAGCGELGGSFAEPGLMRSSGGGVDGALEGKVSLRAEVPEPLLEAMRAFLDHHPNWDQYRLVQAALAGFLVQQGCQSRAVTRCYLANIFPAHRSFDVAPAPVLPGQRPWRPSPTTR